MKAYYGDTLIDDNYDDVTRICDIYKCDECPRYGDDCDGKFIEFEEFDDGEDEADAEVDK